MTIINSVATAADETKAAVEAAIAAAVDKVNADAVLKAAEVARAADAAIQQLELKLADAQNALSRLQRERRCCAAGARRRDCRSFVTLGANFTAKCIITSFAGYNVVCKTLTRSYRVHPSGVINNQLIHARSTSLLPIISGVPSCRVAIPHYVKAIK
jgi:hypothetical protein